MIVSIFDLFVTPFIVLIIYFFAKRVEKNNIHKYSYYKWYTRGLMAKIAGAIGLCMIYQFYYEGGDTVNYFVSARVFLNMASKNFGVFIDIMLGDNSPTTFSYFDYDTDWPTYWKDEKALFVSRLVTPLIFLSFKTFTGSAVLLAWICYSGVWKLFEIFINEFPEIQKQMAISILFIPSVVFWGSGLLKDTITLSAVGLYTYYFYYLIIKKNYKVKYVIYIILSSSLLIMIKPYIFFALVPGSMVWWSNQKVANIRSIALKLFLGPILIFIGIGLGFFILTQVGDVLGSYSIDKVLDKAVESNYDQKQEYYGGNSFDIGEFDASVSGVFSKAHLAITATLFRPFIFEARNPVMFLAGFENTYILLLTLLLLFRLKFFGFFALIGKHPLLTFSMLFALFFAFSVGLATSNFGSLVRLKIPCIPFFVSSLFVMRHFYEKQSKKKLRF